MRKILDFLFGPQTIFVLFTVAIITAIGTEVELKIFDIPKKYEDGILLSNIILVFVVYFVSVWLNKNKDEDSEE